VPVHPPQIGHHFSKHGRVMDVVMVKDFGPLLNLAATATNLEQQRKAEATKVLTGKKAGGHRQSWVKAGSFPCSSLSTVSPVDALLTARCLGC
jgi:hypothetical protein